LPREAARHMLTTKPGKFFSIFLIFSICGVANQAKRDLQRSFAT